MNEQADKDSVKEQAEETIKRAELLYDYQVAQYEAAIDSIRRLEDKATKIFGVVSIAITSALLIIRYWGKDIISNIFSPVNLICLMSLMIFLALTMISWGFTFSAMQTQEFEKPNSSTEMTDFFLYNKRYEALTYAANRYSIFTGKIDCLHAEKARMVNNCSESMLFGAWAFVAFLVSFSILKLTS
ncbi:hypothetical protein KDV93_20650 [Serratia ureilytica]|uniref:hypothetical protein n=1 Tax=Serratia ureilytica TaxID=300181 RepID=UPI00332880C2